MAVTAEFTGGCIDAPIATPDVLTAAPTTGVLPPTTTVLPPTTTVLRPTMGGGTGTIEVAQRPLRSSSSESSTAIRRCGASLHHSQSAAIVDDARALRRALHSVPSDGVSLAKTRTRPSFTPAASFFANAVVAVRATCAMLVALPLIPCRRPEADGVVALVGAPVR
jgi:hypothetical protein